LKDVRLEARVGTAIKITTHHIDLIRTSVAGEARFKIGQPNIIGRSTAAANAFDHAIKLRVFLIQVGQRLGLCHID
jgi:hypothetical protein